MNFRALFWDIDGTLLTTGRAGLISWENALREVAGAEQFPPVRPDGLTDHQIGAWLLQEVGADAALVEPLVRRYERGLATALPMRQGRVLDFVSENLGRFRARHADRLCWLVTGNTARGGAAKLAYYGLDGFFDGGAFSERVEPRTNIARRAWDAARVALPGLSIDEVLIIGDTPHDIEGASGIGARCLAVASGTHSEAELAAHAPWRVVPRLPEPALFAELIGA